MTRPIAQLVDERRQQQVLADDARGTSYEYEGHVVITGTGEAVFELDFPVRFVELPVFFGGFSLGDNATYEMGSLPTGIATMLKPYFTVDEGTTDRLYTGARVMWKTTAPGIGHFRFSGRALVGVSETPRRSAQSAPVAE